MLGTNVKCRGREGVVVVVVVELLVDKGLHRERQGTCWLRLSSTQDLGGGRKMV
jgi:hypothetical protein